MQLVKSDLSKIGINANLKTFPFAVRIAKEGHRGEPFDMDLQAWGADYPDPVDFIDILLDGRNIQAENNNNNAYFNDAKFNNRMQAAGRISNLSKRYSAWALIDRDVMKTAGSSGAALLPHGPRVHLEAHRVLVVPADLRCDEPQRCLHQVRPKHPRDEAPAPVGASSLL